MLHGTRIKRTESHGTGTMAHLFGYEDDSGQRRACTLRYLHVHFTGGSGTASLSIEVDSNRGSEYDKVLEVIPARGNGADINFTNYQLDAWAIEANDQYRLVWVDPGTSEWTVEAGLEEVT